MAHPLRVLPFLALATLPLLAARVTATPKRERVEVLVGQPPPEPVPAGNRQAGPGSGSGEEEPELAWENNGLAFAAQVPWAEPAARRNQWLAAAHRSLFLVSGRGEVRPVPGPAATESQDGQAPDFTRVAVRPRARGGQGAWEAFAWDARGRKIWRLDAKGRLTPYASLADRITYCYNLAADRAGTVYISGAQVIPSPDGNFMHAIQNEVFLRIGRDRSATLLAGGRTIGEVMDGTGPGARFAHQIHFALAEDRGCAYIVDYSDDGAWVRTLRLADGTVTSRLLDDPRFQGRYVHCWTAYHQGVLLVSVTAPPAVFAVDPASGHCQPVYQDRTVPRPIYETRAADRSQGLSAGPCWREGLPVPRDQCASMGFGACGLSVGADGQNRLRGRGPAGPPAVGLARSALAAVPGGPLPSVSPGTPGPPVRADSFII